MDRSEQASYLLVLKIVFKKSHNKQPNESGDNTPKLKTPIPLYLDDESPKLQN